jgi:hypothetical protein
MHPTAQTGRRVMLPIGEQKVRLRLPEGKKAGRVQLLVAGRETPSRRSGRWLELSVPSVLDHEVVAVDV